MRFLIAVSLLVLAGAAPAEVYKWVDENGVVHYTDKPPSENAKPAKLPALQTYERGRVPSRIGGSSPAARDPGPAASVSVKILSPAADETMRGGERTVPVSVAVDPALPPGYRLIYFLDGVAQALPSPSTSYVIAGVERGSHTVSVSVIDAAGQEVGSSAPVTIHVKPPIARKP